MQHRNRCLLSCRASKHGGVHLLHILRQHIVPGARCIRLRTATMLQAYLSPQGARGEGRVLGLNHMRPTCSRPTI
eukprot:2320714-Ditylum_brightwellii.AAC.1